MQWKLNFSECDICESSKVLTCEFHNVHQLSCSMMQACVCKKQGQGQSMQQSFQAICQWASRSSLFSSHCCLSFRLLLLTLCSGAADICQWASRSSLFGSHCVSSESASSDVLLDRCLDPEVVLAVVWGPPSVLLLGTERRCNNLTQRAVDGLRDHTLQCKGMQVLWC